MNEVNTVERPVMPCPFCGGTEIDGPHFTEYIGDMRRPYWWLECKSCPAGMEADGEEPDMLLTAWNARHNAEVSGPTTRPPC